MGSLLQTMMAAREARSAWPHPPDDGGDTQRPDSADPCLPKVARGMDSVARDMMMAMDGGELRYEPDSGDAWDPFFCFFVLGSSGSSYDLCCSYVFFLALGS